MPMVTEHDLAVVYDLLAANIAIICASLINLAESSMSYTGSACSDGGCDLEVPE